MAVVKAGLIQMSLKGDVESDTPEQISEKMIAAHLPLIEQAACEGVQVLGLQELFNLPYVGAEQDKRWYRATERVPRRADDPADAGGGGAPRHGDGGAGLRGGPDRHLLQHRRRDRRGRALPRQVPQDPHPPRRGLLREVLLQARRHWLSGVRDRVLQGRRLYLLRPALPRRLARARHERRRGDLQPLGDRPGLERPPLDPGAAGGGGRELRLYRRQQPRRHGAAVE